MSEEIKLGDKVRDEITGFEGIAYEVAVYLHGCTQYHIIPPLDDLENMREGEWFDEPQLELIQANGRIIEEEDSEIILGDIVFDEVTFFKGMAVARSINISETVQFAVQKKMDKEGKVPEPIWFCQNQLMISQENKRPKAEKRHGGMRSHPSRR